jgi:hypothetical protein
MFASKSIPEHLARGVVGLGAFSASAFLAPLHPWLALAALPLGIFALRGCPTCWLLGLVQTIAPRLGKGCIDGSCAVPRAARR